MFDQYPSTSSNCSDLVLLFFSLLLCEPCPCSTSFILLLIKGRSAHDSYRPPIHLPRASTSFSPPAGHPRHRDNSPDRPTLGFFFLFHIFFALPFCLPLARKTPSIGFARLLFRWWCRSVRPPGSSRYLLTYRPFRTLSPTDTSGEPKQRRPDDSSRQRQHNNPQAKPWEVPFWTAGPITQPACSVRRCRFRLGALNLIPSPSCRTSRFFAFGQDGGLSEFSHRDPPVPQ